MTTWREFSVKEPFMRSFQKAGGAASLLNASIAFANIVVVFGVLGADVAASPTRIAGIVTTQPLPLLLLEFFKILSALAAIVTILAVHQRLNRYVPQPIRFATIAGAISAVLLVTAGVVGAVAIALANPSAEAGQSTAVSLYLTLNMLINGLGVAAVFAYGIWYLLVSVAALKVGLLPRLLCYLGVPLGVASLVAFVVPPVALLVLLLGLIWAIWLGVFLLREPAPNTISAAVGSQYSM
jgi:hypothetical protein